MVTRCGTTRHQRWRYAGLALPMILLLAGCSAGSTPAPTSTDSYCAAIGDLRSYNDSLPSAVADLSDTNASGMLKLFHTIGGKYQAIADAAPDTATRDGWQRYADFFTSLRATDLDSGKQITVNSATTELLTTSAQTTCNTDVSDLLATDTD